VLDVIGPEIRLMRVQKSHDTLAHGTRKVRADEVIDHRQDGRISSGEQMHDG
jgi:hypothetical protein